MEHVTLMTYIIKPLSTEPHRMLHLIVSVQLFSDITCEVDVIRPHLHVTGLTSANKTVKIGHVLQFYCDNDDTLDGSEEIQCLQTGQWNKPFPTCSGMFTFTD